MKIKTETGIDIEKKGTNSNKERNETLTLTAPAGTN